MKYLGIDWGKAKIGLAIADGETAIAFGYGTLENDKNVLDEIADIIDKEKVDKVIIGAAPYLGQYKANSEAKQFGEILRGRLSVDLEYENEIFTTKIARENLKQKGAKNLNLLDDKEAARVILQNWLDRNRA